MLSKSKLADGLEYQRFDIATEAGLAKAKADLAQHRVLGLDIETTSLDPREGGIRTIQLGYLVDDAKPVCYVIDLFALPNGLEVLADLFDGQHVIVGQNLNFESKWLEHHGGIRLRMPLMDTMVADRLLHLGDPQFPSYRGLADLCEHYLKVELDKSEQAGGWDIDPPGQLRPEKAHYAALDVVFALLLRIPLLARLKAETGAMDRKPFPCPQDVFENEAKRAAWPHKPEKNLMKAAGLEFSIIPVVASMELMGLRCDMEAWDTLTKKLEIAEASAHQDMIDAFDSYSIEVSGHALERDLVGELGTNFSSSEQVIALFDQLGIPVPEEEDRKTGKKKRTVDQKRLKDGLVADYPPIAAFLKWKEIHTGLTKAHKQHEYISPITGKLHPRFDPLGAGTGRFSCIAEGQPITVPGGTTPIEDIKPGDWVYALDEQGRPVPKRVLNVWDNGLRETVALKWTAKGHKDPKEGELICTPDHLIRTERGWVEASQLEQGEVVWHLRRGPGAYNRPRMYARGSFCDWEQRILKREIFGKTGRAWHIHHKDEVPANNEVSNLEVLPQPDHIRHHNTYPHWLLTAEARAKGRANTTYTSGPENPLWVHVSRFGLLRMLARAKGRPTRVGMDFEVFKRKCELEGIEIKAVRDRYGEQGQFLNKAALHKAYTQAGGVWNAATQLGIGYRKAVRLFDSLGIQPQPRTNHRVVSIRPAGVRRVYDIEVEDLHNFIASEVCVHNCKAPNVQQVSRPIKVMVDGVEEKIDFRTAYKADPGWKFCGADLDQIELRMPGALCPDDNMRLQFFDKDCDPHSNTARLLNNIPDNEPVEKALRTSAKIVNFSSLYLISPAKLRAYAKSLYNVDMTKDEAAEILDNFRSAYPGIASWHELAKSEARQAKGRAERANWAAETDEENEISARWEVFTVSGRRRILVGDEVTAPNVAATKIQGSGADVVKKAMADIPQMLEACGCVRSRLVGQIHDELILHAPDDECERAAQVLEQALKNAGTYWFKGVVPITCKAEIGESWSECH